MTSSLRRRASAAVSLAVLCVVPVAITVYLARSFTPSPSLLGHTMPRFSARMLDGQTFAQDTTDGKKRVVVFFAPGCSHCRNELKNIDELLPKYKESVDLLGVSLDNSRSTEAMAAELKLKFPIVVADNEHLDDDYKVNILPAFFCFDEHRMLKKFYYGEHTLAMDERLLEEFISSSNAR
jgi:peroxiredoxin